MTSLFGSTSQTAGTAGRTPQPPRTLTGDWNDSLHLRRLVQRYYAFIRWHRYLCSGHHGLPTEETYFGEQKRGDINGDVATCETWQVLIWTRPVRRAFGAVELSSPKRRGTHDCRDTV